MKNKIVIDRFEALLLKEDKMYSSDLLKYIHSVYTSRNTKSSETVIVNERDFIQYSLDHFQRNHAIIIDDMEFNWVDDERENFPFSKFEKALLKINQNHVDCSSVLIKEDENIVAVKGCPLFDRYSIHFSGFDRSYELVVNENYQKYMVNT